MQNGFIERFNGSFRRGVLDMHVFRNLTEVRERAEQWLADHDNEILHDSLGDLTRAEFRLQNDPATSNLPGTDLRGVDTRRLAPFLVSVKVGDYRAS